MNKKYTQTINTYKKLGKKYIDITANIMVKGMPEFIKILKPKSRILDAGCAGGRDSMRFLKAGHEVIGIDIVDVFIAEAKKRVPGATFKKMDLINITFPDNYFDAIWANAVLLHFQKNDIPKILTDFYKILKPGGLVHITVKHGKGTSVTKDKLVENNYRQFTFYYKPEIEKLIRDAGFKIIKSKMLPDETRRKGVKWIGIWGKK